MSYAVRAWRASDGGRGITIGTVADVGGWNNAVTEIDLTGDEAAAFIAECAAALERAETAPGELREPMPGPYDRWEFIGPTRLPAVGG